MNGYEEIEKMIQCLKTNNYAFKKVEQSRRDGYVDAIFEKKMYHLVIKMEILLMILLSK